MEGENIQRGRERGNEALRRERREIKKEREKRAREKKRERERVRACEGQDTVFPFVCCFFVSPPFLESSER